MTWSTRRATALGAGLVLALSLTAPVAAGAAPLPATSATSTATSTATTASAAARFPVPADWQQRRAAAAERFGVDSSPAEGAVRRAIDPGDHACAPTAFGAYADRLLAGVGEEDLLVLALSGALDLPTYDALLFGTAGDSRYALDDDHRQQLVRTFRDAQRFWDVPSSDIQLVGMDGGVLRDRARLARVAAVVFGLTPQEAADYAAAVADLVAGIPALRGGDNPIFTLNAFAFTAEGDPDPLVRGIPDKIVMGDGLGDAFEALGIADVAPQAVLAHEFGHHVQFEDDLFDSPLTGPEATRRTELMADAFATYQVTHKRGLALNAKRVLQAERAFYEVGDCAFEYEGHHGTPNQRLRASQWGADLAASAQKKGHVLPSLEVARLFEAALPRFVAPDAG